MKDTKLKKNADKKTLSKRVKTKSVSAQKSIPAKKVNKPSPCDACIEELIDKYSDSVRGICRKYYLMGGNEDDLFQEGMIGFIQAVKNYNKTKGELDSDAFKKFALMCAKRQIYDAIKHANTQKNQPLNNYVSLTKKDGSFIEPLDLSSVNPEEIFIQKENNENYLSKVKAMLTVYEQQVFDLYLSGKIQSGIARTLGVSSKSVDNALQRIKTKLKQTR